MEEGLYLDGQYTPSSILGFQVKKILIFIKIKNNNLREK